VRWPGEPDFRTAVFVPAGQAVEVALPGSGAPATPVATPAAPAAAAEPARSKRPLWFGIGGGLAGAGIGMIVYGAVRGNAEPSSCKGGNPFPDYYCNPDDVDAAQRQSIAGYATGGVLLAGSAAFFIVGALTGRHRDAPTDKPAAKIPLCSVGLSSAACRIQF